MMRATSLSRLAFLCLCLVQASPTKAFVHSSRTISQTHRWNGCRQPRISANNSLSGNAAKAGRCSTKLAAASAVGSPSFYLTRIVFLRSLAFVYGTAFLVALRQNKALIGDDGLTPARTVLDWAEERGKARRKRRDQWLEAMSDNSSGKSMSWRRRFSIVSRLGNKLNRLKSYQVVRERLWDRVDRSGRPVTTLLWLAKDRSKLNPWLDRIAWAGLGLSTLTVIWGASNFPILLLLWLCQRSLMAVGGPWYGYGWEPQLAELGFHSLFLVPLLSLQRFPSTLPAPLPIIWMVRWYLFRIMMGAGLIKLRSNDPKWKFRGVDRLSAMDYHYETQPVPNPLSKYFHFTPKWWHKIEVLLNHFVELVAPWFLILPFLPLGWRRAAGSMQLFFQGTLILSGNLSFLNWLTAVPALFCLDDVVWTRLVGSFLGRRQEQEWAQSAVAVATYTAKAAGMPYLSRRLVTWAFVLGMGYLSIPVVRNLRNKHQRMNASFDPLRLVGSYGAFGTVSTERIELVISSAREVTAGSDGEDGWREYKHKVKPGPVDLPPRWISPYHYRLDWQLWIAALRPDINQSPWILELLKRLLEGDEDMMKCLFAGDPWEGEKERPRYIRVDRYQYKYHKKDKSKRSSNSDKGYDGGKNNPGPYWDREYVGRFYPKRGIATVDSLRADLDRLDWIRG